MKSRIRQYPQQKVSYKVRRATFRYIYQHAFVCSRFLMELLQGASFVFNPLEIGPWFPVHAFLPLAASLDPGEGGAGGE